MLQNITFSAEKNDIEDARTYADEVKMPLNEMFREWLASIARREMKRRKAWEREYDALMKRLNYVQIGRMPTREERNARR